MASNTRPLKTTRHSFVGLLELEGELCYLKLYTGKSLFQKGLFALGRGRAVTGFDIAQELLRQGVQVPAPLACLSMDGYMLLLTRGIAQAVDLNTLWLRGLGEKQKLYWMERCAEVLGTLHSKGFSHGDTKWTNLLCQEQKMWLVDLEAVKATNGRLNPVGRDLARFTLNAEDRELSQEHFEQFLSGYCDVSGIARSDLLAVMARPLGKMRQRHRLQYGQRGRRLL
jgi:tRNA A-37 threonylcarbamoyl transferase component Bud32